MTSTGNFINLTSTKQKRAKLIEGFGKAKHCFAQECTDLEQKFEDHIFEVYFPGFDDEALLEVTLRYGIFYLEEIDYQKKIHALRILNHLLDNSTRAKLGFNMRAQLLYETFGKYLNDKECVEFLHSIGQSMLKLLAIMEPEYASGEHYYRKHSQTMGSMLTNCYMTTNISAKTVYYKNLILFINQMGVFASRHLDKSLAIAFDSIESSKIGLDFDKQSEFIESSIELIMTIVDTCSKRIHCHARPVLCHCIKILYFYGLNATELKEKVDEKINLIDKVCQIVEKVLKNDKTPKLVVEELKNLKNELKLDANFKILIESII
ncbi:TELO2-interacting 2-like [Brachionus plicatilis]|uniref:TELO2-interacting 2-like n=1 Tax=Brachionus plicatilis TaxID=10195 RepID=A0A3M7RS03_BRAPC|nr:TELO2-interacting 2-like [Brachionus plicatilis]